MIFLTGLLVLIKPMETASLPLLIIGWCLLLYGATECVNAFKIHRERKRIETNLTIKDKTNNNKGCRDNVGQPLLFCYKNDV